MKSRDHGFEIIAAIAVIAFLALYFLYQSQEKDRCRDRGGRVVEIRASDSGGWFCQQ